MPPDFVDFCWIYNGYSPAHACERLLPTGTSELVFRLDANGGAASGVAGPRSASMILDTGLPFSVVAVHFKPGGAFPFFGVPAAELRNQTAALDIFWKDAATLSDRLWEARTAGDRFDILDAALFTAARGRFDRHPAVRRALNVFERPHGARPVADLAERIGLSARRFTDLFDAEVGLSPKAFCRVRRFNAVLERIDGRVDVDWSDVALSCGYFDQAHFNHDFRDFAGVSPSVYLRDRVSRRHVAAHNSL